MEIRKFETVMKSVEFISDVTGTKVTGTRKTSVFDELKLSIGKLVFTIKLNSFSCVDSESEDIYPKDEFLKSPRSYPKAGNVYLLYDVIVSSSSKTIYRAKLYSGYCAILNAAVFNYPSAKKYDNNDYWFNTRMYDKYEGLAGSDEINAIRLLLKHFLYLAWQHDVVLSETTKFDGLDLMHVIKLLLKEYSTLTSVDGNNVNLIIPVSVTDNNLGMTMMVNIKGKASYKKFIYTWAVGKQTSETTDSDDDTGSIENVSYKIHGNKSLQAWFGSNNMHKHLVNFDLGGSSPMLYPAYTSKTIATHTPKAFINPADLTVLFKDM